MTNENLFRYMKENIVIFYDSSQNRIFTYKGKIISISDKFMIFDDIKEGEIGLLLNRIIHIKLDKEETE